MKVVEAVQRHAERVAGLFEPPFSMARLAEHCGVSWRTLEKAFSDFRGLTPVAHVRTLRLDRARAMLEEGSPSVASVAARCGFGSPTTFTLEFRKRFGVPPSHSRRPRDP